MNNSLEGRTAIVTGAAHGIGRAAATALAECGAAVVLADIDGEAGAAAALDLRAQGARAEFVRTDVSRLSDLEAVTQRALEAFGRIDVLVNNAGRAFRGVVDEISEADWNEALDVNLSSVWRGMKCVVPHMRAQGSGSIINLSSVLALTGFHAFAAYSAGKGAINALTQQAALDLGPAGIRVNAIAPGTIMTPLNQKIFDAADDPAGLMQSWQALHPLGRIGQPREVADAVAFLAGDRASFITGTILRVDGGLLIRGE